MVKCGVFFAVRTEFINIMFSCFGFKGLIGTEDLPCSQKPATGPILRQICPVHTPLSILKNKVSVVNWGKWMIFPEVGLQSLRMALWCRSCLTSINFAWAGRLASFRLEDDVVMEDSPRGWLRVLHAKILLVTMGTEVCVSAYCFRALQKE
jgi:hypothetical protein